LGIPSLPHHLNQAVQSENLDQHHFSQLLKSPARFFFGGGESSPRLHPLSRLQRIASKTGSA
jgi:hypothetical protein